MGCVFVCSCGREFLGRVGDTRGSRDVVFRGVCWVFVVFIYYMFVFRFRGS